LLPIVPASLEDLLGPPAAPRRVRVALTACHRRRRSVLLRRFLLRPSGRSSATCCLSHWGRGWSQSWVLVASRSGEGGSVGVGEVTVGGEKDAAKGEKCQRCAWRRNLPQNAAGDAAPAGRSTIAIPSSFWGCSGRCSTCWS
jgi:hypothetical protein